MKQALLILILCSVIAGALPLSASAITLVPCGRSDQQNKTPPDPNAHCQLGHLFLLIIRMINYLISVAAVVAIFFVLNAGFDLVFAMGSPEKIQTGKQAIQNAVVGFALVILAFVFINLLVNGIFSTSSGRLQWWNPRCIYDITSSNPDCPLLIVGIGVPAPGPSPDLGDLPALAGTMLLASNIELDTTADCGPPNHARGVIEALSSGQYPPVCSPSCRPDGTGCTPGGPNGNVTVNPNILYALLDLAQTAPFKITSLTTGIHSAGSNHYNGEAVDIVPQSANRADWVTMRNSLNARGGTAKCENKNDHSRDVLDCNASLVNHIHWTLPFGVGGVAAGQCAGSTCSDSSVNICGPVMPADNCNLAAVNAWTAQITAGVGSNARICSGVNSIKMLKAIVANESDGRPGLTSYDGSSFGLFQIQPQTARTYKSQCGLPAGLTTDNDYKNWLLDGANAQAQACIAVKFLQSLVGPCGCDVRQLAAGYNGGGAALGACDLSVNCGASAVGGACTMCANQGSRPTKRWECLWDNNDHSQCNAARSDGGFRQTRTYAPAVEACYGRF